MRMLVTGGAGFIGSNFVRHVLAHYPGNEIVVLDKLTYAGNTANLPLIPSTSNLSFTLGDICNEKIVAQAMKGCDVVVHFAAETHVDRSLTNAQDFITTNIQGTYVLLEAARKLRLQRFLYVSTDEVYGNACSPEGISRPSIETDAQRPFSPYAASKASADDLAFSYWASYGLPVTITRCGNNYGPYQYPEKQLPLFILNALEDRPLPIYGDGQHSRDWIHVEDHVTAICQLLQQSDELVNGEIFNIGAHEERTTLQNAATVLEIMQKSDKLIRFVPERLGHVRRHAVDTTKIGQRIGWQAQRTFAEGIQQTIDWYKENSAWIEAIKAKQNVFLHNALYQAV